MKRGLIICFVLLIGWVAMPSKANEEEAALEVIIAEELPEADYVFPKDTVGIGAIAYEKALYEQYKAQKKFDYYQQHPEKPSLWERMTKQLDRWLYRLFRVNVSKSELNTIVIVILVVLLLLILFFLYRYKPSLFYWNRKLGLKYLVEDEDLDGIDFNEAIRQLADKGEYAEAIRLSYLKALKVLHEKEYISYDSNKTVNEYVREIEKKDLKEVFLPLSQRFVYYRYGNAKADKTSFEHFRQQSEKLIILATRV